MDGKNVRAVWGAGSLFKGGSPTNPLVQVSMIWQSEGSRMRDLFVEDGPETARAPHLSPDAAQEIRDAIAGRHVCPFCGAVREQNEGVCSRCSMDNTSASRQATKARIGPWFVFQTRNPAAPGMKFDTLLSFVRKGRVKARSVVRGPTTHQLWRFAAHVKGLSREFGICYSCGGSIDRTANLCQHCNRSQEPPADPDVFIEGQQPTAIASAASPVVRSVGAMPLAPQDVAVPPSAPANQGENRPEAKREIDLENEDEETKLKRAEGFLSPQDLAAAFNLDFRPKGRHARAQQQQQQATAIARRPAPSKPRRKAHWGRRIFMLLVLGGVGAGVYAFYNKPQFHAQVINYSQQGLEWGKQKWAEVNKALTKSPHASTPTPSAVMNLDPMPSVPATQPAESRSSQESQPASQETSTPVPSPVKSPEAAPTSKPDAWDQIYGKQSAQKNDPPKATGTIDDVRKLYREAIDAEGNGDYTAAVKKYEQIKEFSRDLWPRDLDLRLTQARSQVHQE